MPQNRITSAAEAIVNAATGYCVSYTLTLLLLLLGLIETSASAAIGAAWITTLYAIASLIRGYCVRRLFAHYEQKNHKKT